MGLTTEFKLIIAGIFLVLLAGSFYWTYEQGVKVGSTSELSKQVKIQTKALVEQDAEFRKTRAKEMQDARKAADDFAKYHQKMVGIYERTIDNIKNQPHQECLTVPVDTEYLSLRNSARGYDTPKG